MMYDLIGIAHLNERADKAYYTMKLGSTWKVSVNIITNDLKLKWFA